MPRKKSNLSRRTKSARKMKFIRSHESEEDRQARLAATKERQAKLRVSETSTQREIRLKSNRSRAMSYRIRKSRKQSEIMSPCAAPGCFNSFAKGFVMKDIPRKPELRIQWLVAMGRLDLIENNYSRLCEVHFTPDMWEKTEVDGKTRLKSNAVPTLFFFSPGTFSQYSTLSFTSEIQSIFTSSMFFEPGISIRELFFSSDTNSQLQLNMGKRIISDQRLTIVMLQKENRRLIKQVKILQDVIEDLMKKEPITKDAKKSGMEISLMEENGEHFCDSSKPTTKDGNDESSENSVTEFVLNKRKKIIEVNEEENTDLAKQMRKKELHRLRNKKYRERIKNAKQEGSNQLSIERSRELSRIRSQRYRDKKREESLNNLIISEQLM